MKAIKEILLNSKVETLNLASNCISGEGLEMLLEAMANNRYLKHLDLGIIEGS